MCKKNATSQNCQCDVCANDDVHMMSILQVVIQLMLASRKYHDNQRLTAWHCDLQPKLIMSSRLMSIMNHPQASADNKKAVACHSMFTLFFVCCKCL